MPDFGCSASGAGSSAFATAFFYGEEFVAVAGKTFFAAQDANYGSELWANDGTGESGPVTDIAPDAIVPSVPIEQGQMT